MKFLLFSYMLFLSALGAAEIVDSFTMAYMKKLMQSRTTQKPDEKGRHGLEHAEYKPEISSLEEVKNPTEALRNHVPILAEANIPNPTKEELKRQESIEDLKYGPMMSKNPNEDESANLIDLDKKLLNSNPEGENAVRVALPAA